MAIPFAITSDFVGVVCQFSRMASCFIRSLTPQTASKVSARMGCNKNGCSLCCAPWHSGLDTVGRSPLVRERPLPPLSLQTALPHRIVGATITTARTRCKKRRCGMGCLRLLSRKLLVASNVSHATCVARLAVDIGSRCAKLWCGDDAPSPLPQTAVSR